MPLVGGLARQYPHIDMVVGVAQGRLALDEIARHVHSTETLASMPLASRAWRRARLCSEAGKAPSSAQMRKGLLR